MDFNFVTSIIFIFCGVVTTATTIQHFYIRYLVRRIAKLQLENKISKDLRNIFNRIQAEAAERPPHNTGPINLNNN